MTALLVLALSQIAAGLDVGFAETDITPKLDPKRPVWMAGYYPGRRATAVNDRLRCRAVVLHNGEQQLAFASVDLIGLQRPTVERIRAQLKDFDYVMVSSTHSHEGPDVIGIWGPSYVQRGVDEAYVDFVVDQVVAAINQARENKQSTTSARFGVAEDESLIRDNRLPKVIDGKIRTLRFQSGDKTTGLLVIWNCHPETMGADNTSLTGDFVGYTVKELQKQHNCPVVYFSGSLGGLMAPPRNRIFNAEKVELLEGDFAYAREYGKAVADLASQAISKDESINLSPFAIAATEVAIPIRNKYYQAAAALKVVQRPSFEWTGDYQKPGPPYKPSDADERKPSAALTEVACLRLGELTAACIPGEIYPELTLGKIQDPADKNADYPDAPLEPSIAALIPDPRKIIFGLANDEMGYFLPKRQWDSAPPYAYGRDATQYGEVNSCGPEAGPIIMQALKDMVEKLEQPAGE